MSETGTAIALFGLLGAFVGAVPGLLGVLFNWLKNRDSISRSLRNIELAKSEVEFISHWLEVVSTLDDDEVLKARRKTAQARLDKLMLQTEEESERRAIKAIEAEVTPKQVRKNIGFYIYSGFFFFMLFGASIDDAGDVSIPHLLDELSGDGLIAIILFGVPWIYLFIRYLRTKYKGHN